MDLSYFLQLSEPLFCKRKCPLWKVYLDKVCNSIFLKIFTQFEAGVEDVNVVNFLPVLMDEYFHYHGSLTTGTCDEAVNWMVFKVIVTIGQLFSQFPRILEPAPQFCCFFCLQNITRNTQLVSKFCSRLLVDMQANARSFLCILKILCRW